VSADEAREVARHVADCKACADQLAFFGKVSRTFDAAPKPHLAGEARQRLEGLGDQFQPDRPRIKPSADVRWVRRLTAAAAILFIVAVSKVIYEHQFPTHDTGTVRPASNPHEPVVPSPQPVSDGQSRGPTTHVPPDSKAPDVTDADFVVGQGTSKAATTGQTDKP
jgi:anti-sigma factor RsiW